MFLYWPFVDRKSLNAEETGTLTNSEDPDEMLYAVTFHQSALFATSKKELNQSLEKLI